MAFIFGVFWMVYHRMWWEAVFLAIIIALLGIADDQNWLDIPSLAILQFAFNLIIGLQANDWRRDALSRRGYIMSDIVVSDNELLAQQRYFDRVLTA